MFNDISIDGEIGNFSNSLLDKGFTKWDKNADSEIEKWFVGKYSSYDAILVANATPISKTAYSLQIVLEFDDNSELNVAEQHLKEKLKSDYRAKNRKTNGSAWIVKTKEGEISISKSKHIIKPADGKLGKKRRNKANKNKPCNFEKKLTRFYFL